MWRIKRRRTKPKTEGNKVIYPKLNATDRPNRYQSRNTYLDVKCNKELGFISCNKLAIFCFICSHHLFHTVNSKLLQLKQTPLSSNL